MFCCYEVSKSNMCSFVNCNRGMNYLHEHKPQAIIHRDLEPS
jgi:serine/threonine protein kinase